MPADIGQVLKPIRKRSFEYYGAEILLKLGDGPHFLRGSCIADVQQNFFLILDEERNAVSLKLCGSFHSSTFAAHYQKRFRNRIVIDRRAPAKFQDALFCVRLSSASLT